MNKTHLLLIFAFLLIGKLSAQQEPMNLTLTDAIRIAQQHSPEAQAARHTYRSAYWNYRFYKANYLPSLTLTSSPTFNEQINKITQPDGTNLFIKQNQLSTDVSLTINQNIPLTGGNFFVKSSLTRLDEFENDVIAYNTQPIVVGYQQTLLGYNSLKWEQRIEPLRYEAALKPVTCSSGWPLHKPIWTLPLPTMLLPIPYIDMRKDATTSGPSPRTKCCNSKSTSCRARPT